MEKDRSEYCYEIYLYSEPYIIYLEDEYIIDINIERVSEFKCIEIKYNDTFFYLNLKKSKRKVFTVALIIYNRTGQILEKYDFIGEKLSFHNSDSIKLYFNGEINGIKSINPRWEEASRIYKKERVSYLRDSKIDTILK